MGLSVLIIDFSRSQSRCVQPRRNLKGEDRSAAKFGSSDFAMRVLEFSRLVENSLNFCRVFIEYFDPQEVIVDTYLNLYD